MILRPTRGRVLKWALLSVTLLVSHRLPAQTQDSAAWSVAVLDKLLAGVKPGQNLVQVGDMQIRVVDLQTWRNRVAGGPNPNLAFDGTAPTWTGGNVYYTFDGSVSAAHQQAFLDGANEWAAFASLRMIARTTQANYVTIQEQAALEGGQSMVGMVGGQQLLSIGPTSWNRPTICHEFGHTLGLVHEHQRSDRDGYVVILTNNIYPGEEPNFVLLPDSRNQGPYDFLSIMHYSRNALSISTTLDTVEPLAPYMQYLNLMGQQFDPVLSAADRAGMASVYGAGPPIGPVVTNTLDSGPGSLRTAMYYAFDHPGTTISFNLPTNDPGFSSQVFTILPTAGYPSLVNATILDGGTQTSYNPSGPAVQLNGALSPPPSQYVNGLRLGGTNCSVRSLVINGFTESAILIEGTNATGNTVRGCYLGLDPTGTMAVTNGQYPLLIQNGARGNTIGGTNAAARNIISGGVYQGLLIYDAGTSSNNVQGNYIGLNAAGTAAIPNNYSGVAILAGAQFNVIGGAQPGMRNVISGNVDQGIAIVDTNSTGNIVAGNYIGLSAAGTNAIPNGGCGVAFFGGAQGNVIGGTAPGARNVISGNAAQGIVLQDPGTSGTVIQGNYIGLNPAGTGAIPNGGTGVDVYNGPQGTVIGGSSAGAGNVISGNQNPGVYLHAAAASTGGAIVQGNYIGVDAAGANAVSNLAAGIQISEGAQSNLVGGTLPAMRNVLSGNGAQGVLIFSPGTSGNIVQGNYIGVNAAGNAAISNSYAGIQLNGGCHDNLVGGTVPGSGNVISGNANQGVLLADPGTSNNLVQGNFIGVNTAGGGSLSNAWSGVEIYNGPQANLIGGAGAGNLISGNGNYGVIISVLGSSGNFVQGNIIGLNHSGNAALPNAYAGVGLRNGAQSNAIGGMLPGLGNLISGNAQQGVAIGDSATQGNLIQGNFIGLDATGTSALPNLGWAGIDIFNSAPGNTIGGALGARNIISGNAGYGISISGNAATHIIQGNTIGLNAADTAALPNGNAGLIVYGGAVSNQIGGITVGAGNFIADNPSDGLVFYDASTTGNAIRGNSIFGNSGLGINLNSVANQVQAAPGLSNALLTTSLTVTGKLTSLASTTFHLDFYASPPPQSTAQGKTYIGTKDVVTGAGGTVSFSANLGAVVPIGQIITATATDPAGNTSQFSGGIAVTAVDSVHDGIPDAWRAAHFGGSGTTTNSQSCATCDPDHDGMNNLQEFLAGTNPTNAASVLRISALAHSGTDVTLSFQSVTGIVYRVESRNGIVPGGWSILVEGILGTGGAMQITDPGVMVLPEQFYRIAAEP